MPELNEYNRRQVEMASERARQIEAMVAAGRTWKEISTELGITRQRAQDILKRYLERKQNA